jgi:hypothetical protein
MPDFIQHLDNLSQSHAIFMAPGFSGRINSGVIFVRNHPDGINFLSTILENADREISDPADAAPYENGHFIHWGKGNQSIYLLEHDLWNNNSHLDANCYIQHYSRGKLRDDYLASRVNARNGWMNMLNAVSGIFLKAGTPRDGQTNSESRPIISRSMKKLLDFYINKYPGYFADIYGLDNETKS